ncbi:MAG TPA: protein translocase subunit SecD [Acetobacteraceae bacterium]|nr:protein translocase subunit SecD [Acetobacteraceae bacterium]
MMYFSRLKISVILGLCLLGALLGVPNLFSAPVPGLPWRTVHLGLDLRGGSYLLMQVDMNAVIKERLAGLLDGVRQALRPHEIFYQTLQAQPDQNRILLALRSPDQTQEAIAALKPLISPEGPTNTPDLDLASPAPGTVTLTLSPVALNARAQAAVQQSIEIVRRRIDETGVVDPEITQQGSNRIVVQLPGVGDPDRIKQLLGKTAHMTFQLVDETANPNVPGPPPIGDEILPMQDNPNEKIAVRRRVDVDGGDLTDARAGTNQQTGEWVVNFAFNSVGARRFADITRANVNHRFAIVLDGKVISAPVIREPITGGRGEISGNFTASSATDLAVLLRAGALPAPLTVVEQRSVGPELGADSIRAGAISLAVGFVMVIAFMAVFYGMFGWFANLCLVVNLVLMLGIMSLLQATLTLPGMAGILLTLGMAVDANILINERIREEQRNGRPPLAALEHGFTRAYSTIFDSNATAFLAHVMLFIFGSGPVKGFAVTITVGIATSLFTAWMLTRLLVSVWYAATRPRLLPV